MQPTTINFRNYRSFKIKGKHNWSNCVGTLILPTFFHHRSSSHNSISAMGYRIYAVKKWFPFTQIAIILNTFGPHILVSLSVALLTLWSQPPDVLKPQTLLGRIVSNCGILLTYNTILCLSSFIWVTHFRRHLMVWKIFCPRFIFASLSLIVTQLVVTFGTIAFAKWEID